MRPAGARSCWARRAGLLISLVACFPFPTTRGDEPYRLDDCQIIPLPDRQISFQWRGEEKLRWHFGAHYPRPFFYPFNGPSGSSLIRMGHPGAPDHDHHRGVWFAHQSIDSVDFWSDNTKARIRQKQWLGYRDGNDEATMASLAEWMDGDGRVRMEQETVAALMPVRGTEPMLELQITMRPAPHHDTVELGKTNFGFLAVRVAKSVSVHFGGGRLTDSEGRVGEAKTFGQRARWMDYRGPVAVGSGGDRRTVVEGITCFDHPDNPRYPTHWHVRDDGWMGASFCMNERYTITRAGPLVLRYLLHAHSGGYDQSKAEAVHRDFALRPGFMVRKSAKKHLQFDVARRE